MNNDYLLSVNDKNYYKKNPIYKIKPVQQIYNEMTQDDRFINKHITDKHNKLKSKPISNNNKKIWNYYR